MAQLVARLVRNEKAGGSNPPSSTNYLLVLIQFRTSRFCFAWGVSFWVLNRKYLGNKPRPLQSSPDTINARSACCPLYQKRNKTQ